VDHKILLNRLYEIGIRGKAYELLSSYLKDRKIITKVNGVLSSQRTINIGVPQGSVIGPTLYLLYIHNIQYANLRSDYKIFADDTVLIYSSKTGNELERKVNEDLVRYKNWLTGNKLTLNTDKTKYIIFKTRNKMDINPQLEVNATDLERVSTYKYLGVIIDEKLKWEEHIGYLIKKIVPLLGAIKRSEIQLNQQSAKSIYHAHIMSHIRYNICNWSSCAVALRDKVSVLINKAIKTIHNFKWLTPTNEIFEQTGHLRLPELIILEKAKLIFKLEKTNTRKGTLLLKRCNVHDYNTRTANNFNHARAKTELARNSCLSSSIRIYNMLPIHLKQCPNIHIFEKRLKNYLKNGYTGEN